jgi:hypothetical protein
MMESETIRIGGQAPRLKAGRPPKASPYGKIPPSSAPKPWGLGVPGGSCE